MLNHHSIPFPDITSEVAVIPDGTRNGSETGMQLFL
jgi:hypothetical protein